MKTQRLRHVIHVEPVIELVRPHLPAEFCTQLEGTKKSPTKKYQSESFSLWITPLDHREYKHYTTDRYHRLTIMNIFNNHVEVPPEIPLAYIMKWPLLVKAIIDAIFDVSSEVIDKINADPKVMFESLRKRRDELSKNDALLDRFVIINGGFEFYTAYRTIASLEERLDIVAAMEIATGITIERRWEFAKKKNMPLKLAPDKNFDKEYRDAMGNARGGGELQHIFDETDRELREAMDRERRNSELGIKTRVNTRNENKDLDQL